MEGEGDEGGDELKKAVGKRVPGVCKDVEGVEGEGEGKEGAEADVDSDSEIPGLVDRESDADSGCDDDIKQEEGVAGQKQKCQALVEVQRTNAKALMRGTVRKCATSTYL